jgi:hypothetical protein
LYKKKLLEKIGTIKKQLLMEINLELTCQTSEIITGKKNSIKDPLYRKDYIFNIYAVESLNTKKKKITAWEFSNCISGINQMA